VGAPFAGVLEGCTPGLTVGHVSYPIHLITRWRLLFPTSQCCPFICLPYGRLALHRGTGRSGNVSTFHVITLNEQLRCGLNAGGASIPCRYRCHLQPDHACKRWETCLHPITPVGWGASLTSASTTIQLISPYCPALALNRTEFPEGFSCRHSNPIRYVVSGLRTGYTARTKHAT
jgi:hypothetical protein